MDKVMAQQARRVLDRIVGYEISPLLWKKVTRGLSAGRVQSVAVKIIVEREKEIREFKPEEYWLIPAVFTTDVNGNYQQQWLDFITPKTPDGKGPTVEQQSQWLAEHHAFKAELSKIGDGKFKASTQEEAEKIFRELEHARFQIADIETKESVSRASPPFITSTLQQAAANRLGFTAKRTMAVAQQLYEGIDLGSMGSLGLITYMRTDSTYISNEALGEVRNHIQNQFGPKYLPEKPNFYADKKSAQQAHEAIRPTDVDLTPQEIRQHLSDEQFKLYDLIWRRFVACQMEPARWNVTTLSITDADERRPGHLPGHRPRSRLRRFQQGLAGLLDRAAASADPGGPAARHGGHPARAAFHQAAGPVHRSLAGQGARKGRHRPAEHVRLDHQHDPGPRLRRAEGPQVLRHRPRRGRHRQAQRVLPPDHGHRLHPAHGRAARPDRGAASRLGPRPEGLLRALQDESRDGPAGDEARQGRDHAQRVHLPGLQAAAGLQIRQERRFLSCSGYPECKFASPCDKEGKMMQDEVSEHKCPNCGKPMVRKNGRFGAFLGCSDYPTCKTTLRLDKEGNPLPPKETPESTGVKCYKCKEGELVIRKSKRGPFMGCNRFPRCRTIVSVKGIDRLKELQAVASGRPKTPEQAKAILDEFKSTKPVAAEK